jgi:hypothetical protein
MGVIAVSGGALLLDVLMLFDPGGPPKKVALLPGPSGLVVAGHF